MAADVDTAGREVEDTVETHLSEQVDAGHDEANDGVHEGSSSATAKPATSRKRTAIALGLALLVLVSSAAGWLGYGAYRTHQANTQRSLYVQVARQGALNLTTIDWQHVDSDIQRIRDSATGSFYDDFTQRQQPFGEMVKKVKSRSVGTITESALEAESGEGAQVLVAVHINTSNEGESPQPPRDWRIRIAVTKVDDGAKVSNVEFVP